MPTATEGTSTATVGTAKIEDHFNPKPGEQVTFDIEEEGFRIICDNCGEEATKKSHRARFCSDSCRSAYHEKKRIWEEQQKLRAEVKGWLSEMDQMGEHYQSALWDLLDEDQKARGPIRAPVSETEASAVPLPGVVTKSDLLDLGVTYGLAAIGLCLMIGFCSRLAALGGAGFLVFVLLTQPPWPTIYPPAPEVVGHALIVDKNFVEMMALLALAAMPVGRWAGLDLFLYRYIGKPMMAACGCKCNCKCSEETAKA